MITLSKAAIVIASTTLFCPPSVYAACLNDQDYKYDDGDKQRPCSNIRINEDRRQTLCQLNEVRDACPQSCGICCDDNPDYEFPMELFPDEMRPCSWISKNVNKIETRRTKYCSDYDRANRTTIRNMCPKACDFCKELIIVVPTAAPTTAAPTDPPTTASPTTTMPTDSPTTASPTTPSPTTATPTTAAPTTAAPTTESPTTAAPTTAAPTEAPTTASPTTAAPTTESPTTAAPTTAAPTEAPTTSSPTTAAPTTAAPTTAAPTTAAPTTATPTTAAPTTAAPTEAPTTASPTTAAPTTAAPTTAAPTTAAPTDVPTTAAPTDAPTTASPTTAAPTDAPTTGAPTPECMDDPGFTFILNIGTEVYCEWITRNVDKIERRMAYCEDPEVATGCPLTCTGCVCEDDAEFEFELLNIPGEMRGCSWITKNVFKTAIRQEAYCDHVGESCPSTCDLC